MNVGGVAKSNVCPLIDVLSIPLIRSSGFGWVLYGFMEAADQMHLTSAVFL